MICTCMNLCRLTQSKFWQCLCQLLIALCHYKTATTTMYILTLGNDVVEKKNIYIYVFLHGLHRLNKLSRELVCAQLNLEAL